MKGEKGPKQNSTGPEEDGNAQPRACCASPHLMWRPSNLAEPVITCTHCGFLIDPDGLLLDWLDPEEIEAARVLEQHMPRILELAADLGLFGEDK